MRLSNIKLEKTPVSDARKVRYNYSNIIDFNQKASRLPYTEFRFILFNCCSKGGLDGV